MLRTGSDSSESGVTPYLPNAICYVRGAALFWDAPRPQVAKSQPSGYRGSSLLNCITHGFTGLQYGLPLLNKNTKSTQLAKETKCCFDDTKQAYDCWLIQQWKRKCDNSFYFRSVLFWIVGASRDLTCKQPRSTCAIIYKQRALVLLVEHDIYMSTGLESPKFTKHDRYVGYYSCTYSTEWGNPYETDL